MPVTPPPPPPRPGQPDFVLVDATNAIVGRLASIVAKWLLLGLRVVIVNAEKAVISGKEHFILDYWDTKRDIKMATNPRRGPFLVPTRPDLFLKRRIRGMLPYKYARGRAAYRRLRVYVGVPQEFRKLYEKGYAIRIPEADASKLKCKFMTVGEICARFGWKGYTEWKVPLKGTPQPKSRSASAEKKS